MNQRIRIKLDTILKDRARKWSDVYKKLNWSKTQASLIRNGITIPPLWKKLILAKELGVDTSVIWSEEEQEVSL